MIFFFKVVTGKVKVSPSVLPQVLVTRTTRSNSNRNVTHFISKKCNTVTFQRSFFNKTIRIWNTLANSPWPSGFLKKKINPRFECAEKYSKYLFHAINPTASRLRFEQQNKKCQVYSL